MSEWTLRGWGRQPWSFVSTLTDGLTCAWADYEGFHVAPCPDTAPPYTHLWAWHPNGNTLVRVRVDEGEAIVGALTKAAGHFPPALVEEIVDVVEESALAWPADHLRVAAQRPGVLSSRLRLLTVVGAQPLTFVRESTT